MKKFILMLFVLFQFATIASVASASGPWPICLPCDSKKDPVAPVVSTVFVP